MHVYLDESGDMGWKFTNPYRAGGSSRYLALAFLFLPVVHRKIPKGIIADMYKRYGWPTEKKCSSAVESQKLEFCTAMNTMLTAHPDIKIDCIVAKKEKVQQHIRSDANKLYNYMCRLVMLDHIARIPVVQFIPDKRSIKVESGNSCSDYLQTILWFDLGSQTQLFNQPQESHKNYNLQFVDWVAHCVWSHFEDGETTVFAEASKSIKIRKLYF